MAAVISITCFIVCRAGMVTGYPIISEIGPWKEGAGIFQVLVARRGMIIELGNCSSILA
jgi:hypothetical protein